jgi:phosphate-selective porin
MLSAKYTSDNWIGAARYRFYGKDYPYQYTRHFGDINFAEYAWIGYRFDSTQQVQVGLNQVPFGLQRLYSSTFLETEAFTMGLEDLDEVGVKYIKDLGAWNLQTGYYARSA